MEQCLTPIFTACFCHGHVPAAFQDAIVQPILKCADKGPALSSNYKRIALASPFSKLMEWCIILMYGNIFSVLDLRKVSLLPCALACLR